MRQERSDRVLLPTLTFGFREEAKRRENRPPPPPASPSFAAKAPLSSHKHSAQRVSIMTTRKAVPALGFRTFRVIENLTPGKRLKAVWARP